MQRDQRRRNTCQSNAMVRDPRNVCEVDRLVDTLVRFVSLLGQEDRSSKSNLWRLEFSSSPQADLEVLWQSLCISSLINHSHLQGKRFAFRGRSYLALCSRQSQIVRAVICKIRADGEKSCTMGNGVLLDKQYKSSSRVNRKMEEK